MTEGRTSIPLKSIALPAEHGGWGFLFEPLLLGLLLAPSLVGAWVFVGALGIFLARHPVKLILNDLLRRRRSPRLGPALRFAIGYGLLAGAGLGLACLAAGGQLLLPLLAALPLALVQLLYDARNQGRGLAPELAGAMAAGAFASAILLAGGWALSLALVPWLLLALKATSAVLYVRARLRLDRGVACQRGPVWVAHGVALLAAIVLAQSGYAPWFASAAFAVLTLRAAMGLSEHRRPGPPRSLGFWELGYGVLTTVLLAVGYRFQL